MLAPTFFWRVCLRAFFLSAIHSSLYELGMGDLPNTSEQPSARAPFELLAREVAETLVLLEYLASRPEGLDWPPATAKSSVTSRSLFLTTECRECKKLSEISIPPPEQFVAFMKSEARLTDRFTSQIGTGSQMQLSYCERNRF